MVRTTAACLAVVLSCAPASRAQVAPPDPEVALGIRQAEEGDYDAAILTLDTAARRLARDPSRPRDLPQAYLYLGIAYLAKGREAAARAKFREALKEMKDLDLNVERFPPKVIDMLEAAREEMRRDAAAGAAAAPAPEPERKGGGKGLLVLGGVAAVGGGVALAASSGGEGGADGGSLPGAPVTTTFPNEVVVFGGGREFVVDVRGSGTLTARVEWQQEGVLLGLYVVNLANAGTVLAEGNQSASRQTSLSLPVTSGSYRVSVTNSSGHGPEVDTRFTLTVVHP
jgi:hypothetical protein